VPDRAALRILDANTNRAMEAARTLEDAARFALGDPSLSAGCKNLRHALRAALAPLDSPAGTLLAARDTPADPGTSLSTPSESRRPDLAAVCLAAGKRLGEALRVIEETAKTLDRGAAAAASIKQLRYAAYDLEQRIVLALVRRARATQWPLCVLITESLCTHHPWEHVAATAIRAGTPCLQLREKGLPDRELLSRARALVQLARTTPLGGDQYRRATIIINDRADIALAAGADGVHLGQDDLPIAAARAIASGAPAFLIGVSTANLEQARRALDQGADYVGLGPVFPSATKPKEHLAGVGYLRAFLQLDAQRADDAPPTPHLAISGITPRNVGELVAAGCRGVAVSSCVCSAPDPGQACRELLAAMAQPRQR
jgi:thiamine-phosphate pyrophosphorylase